VIRIERGVTRAVLLAGPWAVKVPRLAPAGPHRGRLWSLAHGILANLSEAEWSRWPGVCPVVWSLAGLVNVYRRAQPISLPVDYAAISPPELSVDPKPENVGVLDGQLVWVDYAQTDGECVACRRFAARSAGAP
jgi:hypothetical protein